MSLAAFCLIMCCSLYSIVVCFVEVRNLSWSCSTFRRFFCPILVIVCCFLFVVMIHCHFCFCLHKLLHIFSFALPYACPWLHFELCVVFCLYIYTIYEYVLLLCDFWCVLYCRSWEFCTFWGLSRPMTLWLHVLICSPCCCFVCISVLLLCVLSLCLCFALLKSDFVYRLWLFHFSRHSQRMLETFS